MGMQKSIINVNMIVSLVLFGIFSAPVVGRKFVRLSPLCFLLDNFRSLGLISN